MLCNIDASPIYPCAYRELFSNDITTNQFVGLSLCIQGTLPPLDWTLGDSAVYPCVYREHVAKMAAGDEVHGLSLCIQGTRASSSTTRQEIRFIPVYTGNTPRINPSLWPVGGLSLCIQGTQTAENIRTGFIRFIPVYTGNTIYFLFTQLRHAVYPCVYREHFCPCKLAVIKCGLSLCIQGTRFKGSWFTVAKRFIPVYTGNTPIITYCFIIKILTVKFLPIF